MRDLMQGTGDYRPLLREPAHTTLVANVPLDLRRIGHSNGPLYRRLDSRATDTTTKGRHVSH